MAAGLNDWFQAEGAPSAARLAKLTQADCARIFGQDLGSPAAAELMGLFAKALNDLGALLLARFGGDAAALVESAGHSAEKLVAILRIMPFFDDVEIWHGRKVPFMKRAQLTAADLGLAFERDGWGRFDDLDQLTIFADNLVPHVLQGRRHLGLRPRPRRAHRPRRSAGGGIGGGDRDPRRAPCTPSSC